MIKRTYAIAALALALLVVGTPALTAGPVDVIFVVDESGSMSGEHAWLGSMITSLNTGLTGAGATGMYGLVGFGGGGAGNSGRVIGGGLMTAGQFATATGSLITSGGTEDGYAGMNFAFGAYTFTPGAALNIVLVTDEDRDNTNAALTYASILAAFGNRNALLNAVVNNPFTCSGGALGVDSNNTAYKANGTGGFTTCTPGVVGNGSGNTENDYVALALATGGAAWDLNQLRAGGNTAVSFTNAFVDIKVQEIIQQTVPEPGTMALAGVALVALGLLHRKR